jgi:quercetin dioxygenase-like cupin family protein
MSFVVCEVSFAQLQEVIVAARRIVKIVIIVFFIVLFLMTNISTAPNGNALVYPIGDASITSQVKVWAPDFTSPWHYHPYQCVAHIIQGELTVNFDTIASLDNKSPNKSTSITKSFKAGEAFIGTANTWHYSQNLGSEDLIFTTSWLAEKGAPIVVLADKE